MHARRDHARSPTRRPRRRRSRRLSRPRTRTARRRPRGRPRERAEPAAIDEVNRALPARERIELVAADDGVRLGHSHVGDPSTTRSPGSPSRSSARSATATTTGSGSATTTPAAGSSTTSRGPAAAAGATWRPAATGRRPAPSREGQGKSRSGNGRARRQAGREAEPAAQLRRPRLLASEPPSPNDIPGSGRQDDCGKPIAVQRCTRDLPGSDPVGRSAVLDAPGSGSARTRCSTRLDAGRSCTTARNASGRSRRLTAKTDRVDVSGSSTAVTARPGTSSPPATLYVGPAGSTRRTTPPREGVRPQRTDGRPSGARPHRPAPS